MNPVFRRKKNSIFSEEKLTGIEKDLSDNLNHSPKKERRLLVTRFCRYNGTGTTVIGRTDFRPNGSHITTAWFTFLLIPVVPIQSLRITSLDSKSLRIHETLPLNYKQIVYTYLYTVFCIGWLYSLLRICYCLGLSSRPILPPWATVIVFIVGILPPAFLPYLLRLIAEKRSRED